MKLMPLVFAVAACVAALAMAVAAPGRAEFVAAPSAVSSGR